MSEFSDIVEYLLKVHDCRGIGGVCEARAAVTIDVMCFGCTQVKSYEFCKDHAQFIMEHSNNLTFKDHHLQACDTDNTGLFGLVHHEALLGE